VIPRIAHFVFGLREQREPFHFMHYVALESCRRVLEPERIYFHHLHLPWGPWWDRIEPHLELKAIAETREVAETDYSAGLVPEYLRYAHHADLIRLDCLIEHGGLYADIDTIFVRPLPRELYDEPFVIGIEPPVRDELTGERRRSLCNALLLAEPGSEFALEWRARIAGALNGTWNNHSGFLAAELHESLPSAVRVEPQVRFFPFTASRAGLFSLLESSAEIPPDCCSVHLWEHLWFERRRRDFSDAHAGWATPRFLRHAPSTLAELTRPYMRERERRRTAAAWSYFSLDEDSGYGVAADRIITALEASGQELNWVPLVRNEGLGYSGPAVVPRTRDKVVIAHTMPEYFPGLRANYPDAFLVGHTVWETDRLPAHWHEPLTCPDMLIVPSQFNAEIFGGAGVAAPIEVVPHVAPAPLADEPDEIARDVFVFYTIAEWTTRKAVFHTVRAYLDAFSAGDPVLLIVKTSHVDFTRPHPSGDKLVAPGTSSWALARLMAGRTDLPPVRLLVGTRRDEEIGALHARGDCFVSLCRSEGWGIGAFDAAAFGRPVVTTGWGGHLDFLGGSPYLVDHELIDVHDPLGEPSYTRDQHWAEPDLAHASALLAEIAADPRDAREWARGRAAEINDRFSPARVAAEFRAAVERHANAGGA
jgi:glycosyltransferase involved in cell wall biosynthesis